MPLLAVRKNTPHSVQTSTIVQRAEHHSSTYGLIRDGIGVGDLPQLIQPAACLDFQDGESIGIEKRIVQISRECVDLLLLEAICQFTGFSDSRKIVRCR